jgi:hypothetical protein
MTDIIIPIVVFIGAIWWACTADWDWDCGIDLTDDFLRPENITMPIDEGRDGPKN